MTQRECVLECSGFVRKMFFFGGQKRKKKKEEAEREKSSAVARNVLAGVRARPTFLWPWQAGGFSVSCLES